MLSDELWPKLQEIMLQHGIYDRPNLRTFIFVCWDFLLAFTLDPEKYITSELPAPSLGMTIVVAV